MKCKRAGREILLGQSSRRRLSFWGLRYEFRKAIASEETPSSRRNRTSRSAASISTSRCTLPSAEIRSATSRRQRRGVNSAGGSHWKS